jgi:hypothetical protein
MRLHNFCIDRIETDWNIVDLTLDLIVKHIPLYEECLDDVDPVDPTAPRLPVIHGGKRNNTERITTKKGIV